MVCQGPNIEIWHKVPRSIGYMIGPFLVVGGGGVTHLRGCCGPLKKKVHFWHICDVLINGTYHQLIGSRTGHSYSLWYSIYPVLNFFFFEYVTDWPFAGLLGADFKKFTNFSNKRYLEF